MEELLPVVRQNGMRHLPVVIDAPSIKGVGRGHPTTVLEVHPCLSITFDQQELFVLVELVFLAGLFGDDSFGGEFH